MKKQITIGFFIVMIMSGCNHYRDINKLNLNFEKWKNDPFGCKNNRADIADSVIKNKIFFIGFDTIEVIKYFGKPDKYYHGGVYMYYIEPNYHCNIVDIDSGIVALSIEFNWLHKVNKINKVCIW